VAWAAAELVTNRLTARYAVGAVIGLAVLVAAASFLATRGSALFGTAFLGVALAAYAGNGIGRASWDAVQHREALRALPSLLAAAPDALPVAVDDPLRALELMYYARPEARSRLVFLVDPASSLRYGQVFYSGTTWLRMRRTFPGVRAEPLGPFRRSRREFLVYATGSPFGWLEQRLAAERADVTLVAARGGSRLLLVRDRDGGDGAAGGGAGGGSGAGPGRP
jgi:hypothetical protein